MVTPLARWDNRGPLSLIYQTHAIRVRSTMSIVAELFAAIVGPLFVLGFFSVLDQLIETIEPELRFLRTAWELVVLGLGAQLGLLGTITTINAHKTAEIGLYFLLANIVISIIIVMIRKYFRGVTSAKLQQLLVDIAFSLGAISIVLPAIYVVALHRREGAL